MAPRPDSPLPSAIEASAHVSCEPAHSCASAHDPYRGPGVGEPQPVTQSRHADVRLSQVRARCLAVGRNPTGRRRFGLGSAPVLRCCLARDRLVAWHSFIRPDHIQMNDPQPIVLQPVVSVSPRHHFIGQLPPALMHQVSTPIPTFVFGGEHG
jgi:hypothetical protein